MNGIHRKIFGQSTKKMDKVYLFDTDFSFIIMSSFMMVLDGIPRKPINLLLGNPFSTTHSSLVHWFKDDDDNDDNHLLFSSL